MKEKLQKILNDPRRVPVTVGVVAFIGGSALGYFLGRRASRFGVHEVPPQLAIDFETLVEGNAADLNTLDEIVEALDPDARSTREPLIVEAEELEAIRERRAEEFIVEHLGDTRIVVDEEVDAIAVRQSVFASDDDEWNYEEELKTRNSEEPYVIHKDEFFADEMGFTQSTLSYYSGDDILADEDDRPVYNYDQIIGPLRFGHGSGDPNVFHVRNEKRRAEYEILFNAGSYSVEVLGLEIENNERTRDVKHSSPKFRRDD